MNREPIHTEELNTYTIKIYADEDPMNPREWDNLGTLVQFGRSGRKPDSSIWDEAEYLEEFLKEAGELPGDDAEYQDEDENGDGTILTLESRLVMERLKSQVIWFAVDFHDYGSNGARISIDRNYNHENDDEPSGVIMVKLLELEKEYGVTEITPEFRTKIEGYLEGEIETLNQYMSGDCYGYVIEDSSGEHLDSCWGYLGDYEYCLEEAKSVVKTYDYQPALLGI